MVERYTIFLCGFGRRAQDHLAAISTSGRFDVVGICDTAVTAREAANRFGPLVASQFADGLAQTQPDCVLVATPPSERLDVVRTIFGVTNPRALVIEKPLALTPGDAEKIVSLSQAHGAILQVGHQLPWTPEFSALHDCIHSGNLGKIKAIHGACFGKIFDQGSHLLDLILSLVPDDSPAWIQASGSDALPELARLCKLPAGFALDTRHPGLLWTAANIRMRSGIDVRLDCGVLDGCPRPDLGPWLQKRITVVGEFGTAEAHCASHFKYAGSKGPALEQRVESDLAAYEGALIAFYRDLARQLDGSSHVTAAVRETNTVALMCAIDKSARTGLPIDWAVEPEIPFEPTEGAKSVDAIEPGVSVIVPMEDHRGMGPEAIRSWTVGQRCQPHRYEVIVLLDALTADLEPLLRPLLRPQDRIVQRDAANEMELYHYGATIARREFLLFTEPHCVAEPQAIAETEEFFRHGTADGFCARSTPISPNAIARLESRFYDDGFVEWSKPEHWGKVILRGIALPRQLYLASGGFRFQYSRFCEWLFAAELNVAGYTLHYAPGVGVAHLYSENLPLLDRFIQEFTDGESLYRLEHGDAPFCRDFFGDPPEWLESLNFSSDYHRAVLQAGLIGFFNQGGGARTGRVASLLATAASLPFALFGKTWQLWRYGCTARLAKLRTSNPLVRENTRYVHFARYWDRTTAYYRVAFALSNSSASDAVWQGQTVYGDSHLNAAFQGIYPTEKYQGHIFRWTTPSFGIRLGPDVPAGVIELQLCPFRGHPPVPLAYLIDATGKRRVSCQVDTERMQVSAHFETKKLESPAWLIFIVSRWWEASRVGKDGRALGWAINRFGLRQSSDLFADKQHEPGPRPDSLDNRLIDGVFNAMPTGRDQ